VTRRITIRPGKGATVNGLPSKSNWRGGQVIVSGEFDFEVEDLEHYVQVRYERGGVRYTYRDPSGALEIGDLVEVPVSYGTKVGTVMAFGHGGYTGPIKDVAARLARVSL
jgi:hypothetical protein